MLNESRDNITRKGDSDDQRDVPAVGATVACVVGRAVNANIDRLNCYLYINQKLQKRKGISVAYIYCAVFALRFWPEKGPRPSVVPSVFTHVDSVYNMKRKVNQLLSYTCGRMRKRRANAQ